MANELETRVERLEETAREHTEQITQIVRRSTSLQEVVNDHTTRLRAIEQRLPPPAA